ncbi:hypothetical protein ACFL3B_05975 [Gemmatimonadota bacterium]
MLDTSTHLTRNARIALTVVLAVYGFVILLDPGTFRLIDNVDLAIHEAGHVFFGPFGEFIGFLGGTLMQLIVPLTFFGYFLHHRDRYAASVLLWWVGQNLWNISVYVKDARSMELPLVGGGVHDWRVILGETGLLPHDQAIGQAVYTAGVLCYLGSIGWGAMGVFDKRRDLEKT